MKYRTLGRSGLHISEISLGSWTTFGQSVDQEATERCMHAAYEQGINFFDGAEVYGLGAAEEAMGKVFKKTNWSRDTYVVSSKVIHFGKWPTQRGLSRKHLVEACEAALQRMHLDYLDLLFCHRPDASTPPEEIVHTMNELIRRGKIFYWGTSEFSADQLRALWDVAERDRLIGPLMEQTNHSMFHRHRVEKELRPLILEHGMGTTIYSPLAQGLLTGKYNQGVPEGSRAHRQDENWRKGFLSQERLEKVRSLAQLGEELGVSTAQLALAWCLKNPHVSTAIIGATRADQVRENAQAVEAVEKLDPSIMTRVEEILGNRP